MNKKILLAEDERDVRQFLRVALAEHHFDVTAVDNGAEAVVAATEQAFDLYLLDMMMPGLDGVQTIRVLRKVTPQVPIIGLTGYVGQGFMAQSLEFGVTCLNKPIEIVALVKEINETMKVKNEQNTKFQKPKSQTNNRV
ncbi:MAG: response regulator [Chloroflexi bacterium]|nr:response regulator [Chloroflexota bacterium]